MFKLLMKLNYYYSIIWIKATGTDKYTYREKSRIHELLTNAAYRRLKK